MATKKSLHLFTTEYPLNILEAYLENEIPVTSEFFDDVSIVTYQKENFTQRPLPNNVHYRMMDEKNLSEIPIGFTEKLYLIKLLILEFIYCDNKKAYFKRFRELYSNLKSVYRRYKTFDREFDFRKDDLFYSFWMNDWALMLMILKHKKRINHFFFRCAGFDIWDERHPDNYMPFRKLIYKEAFEIYPNNKLAEIYLRKKNICPEKIHCEYWGTKDYGLNPSSVDKKDTIVLVSCGNLIPLKRIEFIPEILKKVEVSIKWYHFGVGVMENEIKKRIEALPSHHEAILMGGVPNEDIMKFYQTQHVDLFISLSETEGLPVSLQEACSFGIPMIATNVGGVSEVVNEKTGVLIPANFNIDAVAEIFNSYAESNLSQSEFRKNVRKHWEENFDAGRVYNSFYQKLLGKLS